MPESMHTDVLENELTVTEHVAPLSLIQTPYTYY